MAVFAILLITATALISSARANIARESLDDLISVKSGRSKKRITQFMYPVEFLSPVVGSVFSISNLTTDSLYCFGNRDYKSPAFTDAFFCMFIIPLYSQIIPQQSLPHYVPFSLKSWLSSKSKYLMSNWFLKAFNLRVDCTTLWGSRPVVVEVNGSVELLKLHKLPPETSSQAERVGTAPVMKPRAQTHARMHTLVNATRWMHVSDSREVRHIPAEPIHICARSDDWEGLNSSMKITFRSAHIREKDKQSSLQKLFIHVLLLSAVSSVWLLPYLVAFMVAVLSYMHGINYLIRLLMFSAMVVCIAPLFATKKNRFLYRLYLSYFFTRHEETKVTLLDDVLIRQRTPLFQALFFSSALMCIGSASSYAVYYYFGVVDREIRNALLKLTISMAVSWFTFFLCRSFERFCRDWAWIAMSVGLAQMLDHHLNPLCRTNVIVATIILSQVVKFSVPKFVRISRLDTLVKLCLPKLQALLLSYGSHLHKRYHHYRYRSHHHVHVNPSEAGNVTETGAVTTMYKTLSTASLKANTSIGHLNSRRRGSHGSHRSISSAVGTQPLSGTDRDGNTKSCSSDGEGRMLWESTEEEFYEERNQKPATQNRWKHSKNSAVGDMKILNADFETDLKISEASKVADRYDEGEDARFDAFGETEVEGLEGLFYEESSEGDEDSEDEDGDGDDNGIDDLPDFEENEDDSIDDDGDDEAEEEDEDDLKQDQDEDDDENLDEGNPVDFSFYSTASSNSPLRPSRRQKKSRLFYSTTTTAAAANADGAIKSPAMRAPEEASGVLKAPLWKILQNWERMQLSVFSPSPDECPSGGGSNDRELSPIAKIADMSELYGDKSTEFKNRMAFMRFEGINLSALISNEQIIRTIELYKKILRLPIESAKIMGDSSSNSSIYQKADSASSDFPTVDKVDTTSLQNTSDELDDTKDNTRHQRIDESDDSISKDDVPVAVSSHDTTSHQPVMPPPPPPALISESKTDNDHRDDLNTAPQSSTNPPKMSLTINVDSIRKKTGALKMLDINGANDINSPDPQKDFFPYNQFNNIVGALTLPLSLVGPLKFGFHVKSYLFERKEKSEIALNEEMEKHSNRKEKQIDTYAWLPLATLDKTIVDNLQFTVNCLNDVSHLPSRKRRDTAQDSTILGTMMISKLYPPIRRKTVVSVRIAFDSCDHAASFHLLCVQQRQSMKDGCAQDGEESDAHKEYLDAISIIDDVSSIVEENVVLLHLSLATSMTSYITEDSLIYRYCDFPSCQPMDVVSSEDINSSGILLAGNYSLQHLLDKGRAILLRYIERIRAQSMKAKSAGLSSMKMNFFDESNPPPSLSTPDGYRGNPIMGFRNHYSHYVSTTVSISSRVAVLLGFTNNELLLHVSEKSLMYDRSLIDKYLHRILCALFTALNIDVSVIPNILANFQIGHSLVTHDGEGKKAGEDAMCDEGGQRSVRVEEHQRLDMCLFIPVMFGDREAMTSLRTDTAAPDTNTELCLDLLLGNVYSDIGDQVLFPIADDDEDKEKEPSNHIDNDNAAQIPGPRCKYLPDSDSIFGRTISGSILLAYLAYLQKSYRRS